MRIGVIDLGTNSVRFAIYRIKGSGRALLVHKEKRLIQLGKDVFRGGELGPKSSKKLLEAFKDYRRICFKYHLNRVVAVGTSALREAANSAKLQSELKRRFDIDLNIIPGEEEARIIAQGVIANDPLARGSFAVVDIGGGSTEVAICKGDHILHQKSFPWGAARLSEELRQRGFRRAKKRARIDILSDLRLQIRREVYSVLCAENWPSVPHVIASSGTIRAILRLCRDGNQKRRLISHSRLRKVSEILSLETPASLTKKHSVAPWRAGGIAAAAILLDEITCALGAKSISGTKHALTEGLLAEELRRTEYLKTLPMELIHKVA